MQRRFLSIWFPNGLALPVQHDCSALRDERSLEERSLEERSLAELALWCQAFTPLTAVDPPDGILLDISGCAHLFGGEAAVRARLGGVFPHARCAIADTAAAAWALAHYGGSRMPALADLPLAALRISDSMVARLRRLGLRRIGELARLSRGEIRAGFGADLLLKLDRLQARVPEALSFMALPPEWRQTEYHAEPLLAAEQLRAAIGRLVPALCRRLAAADLGLTGLVARFHRVDARFAEDRIGFAAPTRDAPHIVRLMVERLETIDPGFGVEAIVLDAETATLTPAQGELGGTAAPDYARTIDRLMRRVRLSRLAPVETHIPERAVCRVPVTAPEPCWTMPAYPRPLRLFDRPEPIVVIAPVPDDPPRMMRWRGVSHTVINATGPERIARDWWRHRLGESRPETERIRDYYVVEIESGQVFWVFRAGLHGGEATPRWFIHGSF